LVPPPCVEIARRPLLVTRLRSAVIAGMLCRGVKDIIVFDPRTLLVLHGRQGQATLAVAPQDIALQCGSRVSVLHRAISSRLWRPLRGPRPKTAVGVALQARHHDSRP
jgi:hypothetical protein